jgi:hypothetical protein
MGWQTRDYKSTYRRMLKTVRGLKTWQLIVLLLLGMLVSATLLRLNNVGMNERRSAVIKADEAGDADKLRNSIVDLQRYVTHHMNTSLDNGFFLSSTYARDRDAALEAAGGATNPNSAVYQQASIECRAKWQGGRESFRNDYVQCVIDRVSALAPQGDAEKALQLPKADAYRVNFTSPLWSFDLAGIAVAFCALVLLVIIGRFVAVLLLRFLLRRHYRSI